jgi:excisionase family DNA binding protein
MALQELTHESLMLTTDEVAEILRIERQTLALWRMRGSPLKYSRVGRRVLYNRADVMALLERRSATSTAEMSAAHRASAGVQRLAAASA